MGFQSLCNKFVPDTYMIEDFSTLYMIRRIKGSCFFVAQSCLEKLIVNLVDSDHGWHDTVIRISGA